MIDRIRGLIGRLLGSRIFRDSSVLVVAGWVSLGLSLVASVILARRLGPDRYGLVILGMTLVTTIVQFLDIRTDEGLIHFMGGALAREEQSEAVTFFYVALSADTLLMMATVLLVAILRRRRRASTPTAPPSSGWWASS